MPYKSQIKYPRWGASWGGAPHSSPVDENSHRAAPEARFASLDVISRKNISRQYFIQRPGSWRITGPACLDLMPEIYIHWRRFYCFFSLIYLDRDSEIPDCVETEMRIMFDMINLMPQTYFSGLNLVRYKLYLKGSNIKYQIIASSERIPTDSTYVAFTQT